MKKMLSCVLAVAMLFSCSVFAQAEEFKNPLEGLCQLGEIPESFDKEKEYKIMVVGPNAVEEFPNTFYAGAKYALEEIEANYGLNLSGILTGPQISVDPIETSAICEQAVSQGYDAIICNAEAWSSLETTWKKCAEQGVPVVGWWDVSGDEETGCIGFVSPDHEGQCKLAVEFMIDYIAKEDPEATPKVMVMSQGNAEKETKLVNASQAACDAAGVEMDVVIVGTDSATQIEAISNAYQANPDYNLWIGYTGEAPISCATVMNEAGTLEETYILGIDATKAHLDALIDGRNVGILEQGVYSCGYKCVYMAVDYLINGELTQFNTEEYTQNTIVTEADIPVWQNIVNEVLAGME